MSLYFSLESNSNLITTSRTSWGTLEKRAILEFVIVSNKKNTPDVVLYEALDTLTNEICEKQILLDTFKILSINEGNQSGVVYDVNENPIIMAQYQVDYESKY